MRKWLFALACMAAPASAQYTATMPSTCRADGSQCVSASTVVNPDGTAIGSSTPVVTNPTSTSVSGTVAVANTYQSALAASSTRKGCLIINTSAAQEYVFLGAPGSATTATSIPLASMQTLSCAAGNMVVGDQISITSPTVSSTFLVISQ